MVLPGDACVGPGKRSLQCFTVLCDRERACLNALSRLLEYIFEGPWSDLSSAHRIGVSASSHRYKLAVKRRGKFNVGTRSVAFHQVNRIVVCATLHLGNPQGMALHGRTGIKGRFRYIE